MKVLLLGNCQIESIKECLRVICPSFEVTSQHSWNLMPILDKYECISEYLQGFDLVLSHRIYNDALRFDSLLSYKNVIEFPVLNFSAFHPDCSYLISGDTKSIVRSVMGDYNSNIVAYCYSKGIPLERAINAFREDIFSFVGYFDAWQASLNALEREFSRCGIDAHRLVMRWIRHAPFMHSINHPHLFALKDVITYLFDRENIGYNSVQDIYRYIQDPLLRYSVWPIYPEIAALYGTRGEYYFKADSTTTPTKDAYNLEDFVNSSYRSYTDSNVKIFHSDTFEVWDKLGLSDLV